MATTSVPRPAQLAALPRVAARPIILSVAHPPRTRHGFLRSLDAYFRREDTWLARGLVGLSAGKGKAYTGSTVKRVLDVLVSAPLAIIAILFMALLVPANKILYPRRPALFRQDRVGHGGATVRVTKIRSMLPGATAGAEQEATLCTAFGRFLRRHYLDELPQLLQVLTGRLSLVGIRVLPRDVYEGLAVSWSRERFEAWQTMYAAAPLGLTGAHQVFRKAGKEDSRRFHRDMFYARHASLSFDLYLLWRTLGTTDGGHSYPARKENGSAR